MSTSSSWHPAALALGLTGWFLTGCGGPAPPARGLPGDMINLAIKDKALVTEVACDDLSRQRGLMHREKLGENSAMLFIFPDLEYLSFWMRNTQIPLSIAFLDDSGKILQIEDMKPKDESRTRSKTPVRYALEVNQGWFARHGVQVGDAFDGFPARVGHFRPGGR